MATEAQAGVLAVPGQRRIDFGLGKVRRFARRQPLGTASAVVIAGLVLMAVFADAPFMRTTDPKEFGSDILVGPSADHWFGTNRNGQDLYSRVVYGARPSLMVGTATVLISVVGGTVLGLLAGYLGRFVDTLISRLSEVLLSFPAILFGLVVATWLGPGLRSVIIAISIIFTPVIMRIIRGGVLVERQRVYVEAARVIGCSEARVMFRHILPNIGPLVIVVASTTLPAAILAESALTFLGVGLPLGEPSWGNDLGPQARAYFNTAWWLAVFPGLALSLTVLAFNLLGDALRDELDPRLRGSGLGER
ncbi:ABC transporter permease [Tepidiforma bonchosmolovskayae]|uniref:ABC transporter permease n=1 Tax=Tepidiforma bonchosmolovskayae TaxID=2601677 RepID=A0ABX6C1S2_9CHLR|nr:ABC transporter permease [Tepidiforma bonchosmolovskayae]QFG03172.1 ABC transporter permease [Tepidiforma bonchosmolovskayae]